MSHLIDVEINFENTKIALLDLNPVQTGKRICEDIFSHESLSRHRYYLILTSQKTQGIWGPLDERTAFLCQDILALIDWTIPRSISNWFLLLRLNFRHFHVGLGALAFGAIELAMWDCLAKKYGLPVWKLFENTPNENGRYIQTYGSCLGCNMPLSHIHTISSKLVSRGWVKLKWDKPIDIDTLEWIPDLAKQNGPGCIAVDLRPYWENFSVIKKELLLDTKLFFIEEPIAPWDEVIELTEFSDIPIAAGEHIYGPCESLLLEQYNIWQPDALFCGGFINFLKICRQAVNLGKILMPHGNTLVPALHAAQIIPEIDFIEWHFRLEPLRQAHLSNPFVPNNSLTLEPPVAAGWGGDLLC